MGIKLNFGKGRSEQEKDRSLQEKFEERKKQQGAGTSVVEKKETEEKGVGFLERLKANRAAKKAEREALKKRKREEKKAEEKRRKALAKDGAKKREEEANGDGDGELRATKERVLGKKKKTFWFKRLFSKGTGKETETKQEGEGSGKPVDGKGVTPKEVERNLEKTAKQLRKKHKKQKREGQRTAQYRKRMLGSLLVKAGYEVKPEKVQQTILRIAVWTVIVMTAITLIIAAIAGKSALGLMLFYIGLWTAVFAFLYLFMQMVLYVYLDIRIYRRTKELEEVLPDFLQLASANISAGMPIDRALWFAVRPNFGVLAKEIESVAKATLAGEELSESLIQFTERYDSVTLKRSINILLEGLAAGGELADLLNKIALNIQETKILRKEMSANVATYAIFITFASIVMAPILFALATELLVIIVGITSGINIGGSSASLIQINLRTSKAMITDFRWFSIMMLTVSSLMSASIVSVIRRGRVKEGLRNLPLFFAVSMIIYFVAMSGLHFLLGGLL